MPRLQPVRSRGRETHQTQMWVSSRITARRPSRRWQQAPRAHGTQEPNLEGFGPGSWLILRFSRPPTLQPAGRAQMEGPLKGGRHARRLLSLSSVLARPNYRGSKHAVRRWWAATDRKSTRLNSSHANISYA